MYLTIILLSMDYCINFYSLALDVLDLRLEQSEMLFGSFEDLERSQLPVYTFKTHYAILSWNSDNLHLKNLLNRSQNTTLYDCVDDLKNGKHVICIDGIWTAQSHIDEYRKANRSDIMKIAKPLFFSSRVIFSLEAASPYAERFADIQQRIHESGIWYMPSMKNSYNDIKNNNYPNVTYMDQKFFVKELLFFLSIGFLLSGAIFLAELFLANIGKLKNNKVFKNIINSLTCPKDSN